MELEWILLSKSTNIVEQIRKVQTNLWNPKRLSYLQIDHVEECYIEPRHENITLNAWETFEATQNFMIKGTDCVTQHNSCVVNMYFGKT